ncbi:MAG: PQQ-binding-like beta-propeller repeat protein [Phycisphaerales bacterium]|nr:MAG: PQQ-binding-like beta-propeller repeat protein [Phycisphaerales bacterium]
MNKRIGHIIPLALMTILNNTLLSAAAIHEEPRGQAKQLLETAGLKGGLVIHIGCGNGRLTTNLRPNESFIVQGLDDNPDDVELAREYIKSLNLYGRVTADHLTGTKLPYVDNTVNLVVAENLGRIPMQEVVRVLAPEAVALVKEAGRWVRRVKPRPKETDEWTHYLYDASNNAVSNDTLVGPPRRMQWVAGPLYGRHHDHMSSVSAVVSSGGRVFYILDEGSRFSMLASPNWSLIARDAFNGTLLWRKRIGEWYSHLWPLKNGPAQAPRRLVAVGDRLYVTLGLGQPLVALDAATGQTVQRYEQTEAAEEVIASEGELFVIIDKLSEESESAGTIAARHEHGDGIGQQGPRDIVCLSAETGEVRWISERRILPITLAVDKQRVFFHDGQSVVCLDRRNSRELWRSDPVARTALIRPFYAPTLLVHDGVVLFAGGNRRMTALSAQNGKVLWAANHPPSGYASPEDLLVVEGLVWAGNTAAGIGTGVFTGRDVRTGQVISEFPPDVQTYWFHHRCHRGKATLKYLLMSRAGIEFIDINNRQWMANHWVRGACLYGIMPANGLLYAPHHPCACYLEAKLSGFNALAPASTGPRVPLEHSGRARLEKGPAYGQDIGTQAAVDEWPTYRHDSQRSGCAGTVVGAALEPAWKTHLGGRLTGPVVAEGKLFVASTDEHTVHAFEARSGEPLWQYTAGGRVDSPPTVYKGRVFFGSADGWVYCLRASDGRLIWRFRAALMDQRLMAFGQLESVWPVHGSVLIHDGLLYCVSGRSMFLDNGMALWRLDPYTGRMLSMTTLNDRDQTAGKDLQSYVSWLNMPTALPDILSTDGKLVYMRSQPFNLDGTRLTLEKLPSGGSYNAAPPATQRDDRRHLFCPTGFLDDSWWHRTYWMYGSTFVSGWSGYYLAGQVAPAGRILVFDRSRVYGFGRKPQYYRWTTPIEHHLFAADKAPTRRSGQTNEKEVTTVIRVKKSPTLDPAHTPFTVEAWVLAENTDGVIVANGGSAQGCVLYFNRGRPSFAVRINGRLYAVAAKERAVGSWVHLAGMLDPDKGLQLYVDGKLAGSSRAPGLITQAPLEPMEIGADDGTPVGDYDCPSAFKGVIDEVMIYHRTLDGREIAEYASNGRTAKPGKAGLILWYSFDQGAAVDVSGNNNNGQIQGAVSAPGRVGRAMRFVPGFLVRHHWATDVPMFVRAMVLAGDTLFIAGPPDMVEEQEVFRREKVTDRVKDLVDRTASLDAGNRAMLWAVSTADGSKLSEYDLDSPPVFDGMIAASGRLYIATVDGRILCFSSSSHDNADNIRLQTLLVESTLSCRTPQKIRSTGKGIVVCPPG